MHQQIVNPADGAPHGGPYSHGIRVGDLVFTAGQGPFDSTGTMVGDDVATQTEAVLDNIERILREAGSGLGDVVRVTAHLQDLHRDFAAYNEVYARRFGDHRPCRTTVGSTLGGFLVEIDAVAVVGSGA